jgi:hypothetical protein
MRRLHHAITADPLRAIFSFRRRSERHYRRRPLLSAHDIQAGSPAGGEERSSETPRCMNPVDLAEMKSSLSIDTDEHSKLCPREYVLFRERDSRHYRGGAGSFTGNRGIRSRQRDPSMMHGRCDVGGDAAETAASRRSDVAAPSEIFVIGLRGGWASQGARHI